MIVAGVSLRTFAGVGLACALTGFALPSTAAAPPEECLRVGNGVCFAPDHPTSNQRIAVLIVLGNRPNQYACIRDLAQSIDGRIIRYQGIYDDCGDTAAADPRKSVDPLYYDFSLGPLPPGSYEVEFDAPIPQDGYVPALQPVSFRTTLDVSPATDAPTAVRMAIEFYRPGADHYFVTVSAEEINKLDSGTFPGWKRTGEAMGVYPRTTALLPPLSAVCRLYGNPAAGLDSHFYSASPAECQSVVDRFPNAWIYESPNVFVVALPNTQTGICPEGTIPVYRFYNNRTDVNHRFTTSFAIRTQMIVAGWIREGYGPDAVAMCAAAE